MLILDTNLLNHKADRFRLRDVREHEAARKLPRLSARLGALSHKFLGATARAFVEPGGGPRLSVRPGGDAGAATPEASGR